jgi:hypothetical protein
MLVQVVCVGDEVIMEMIMRFFADAERSIMQMTAKAIRSQTTT